MNQDLFAIFKSHKILPEESICLVEKFCDKWQTSPFLGFLETHLLSEEEIADQLALHLRIDRLYDITCHIDMHRASELLPYRLAKKWECFPISLSEKDNFIELAVADPTNKEPKNWIEKEKHYRIKYALAERRSILKAIRDNYPLQAQMNRT